MRMAKSLVFVLIVLVCQIPYLTLAFLIFMNGF